MKACFWIVAALLIASSQVTHAAGLSRATFTEVVKDVSVLPAGGRARREAKVREIFATPDVLRTGAESRAEMVAPDQTVTRIGANTLFSFEPRGREINLQRGSVLFNSPAGKGGGTIKTAAATASVLGTTLIVVTTPNGGFKVLLLEGRGRVRTPRGEVRALGAGEMTYVLPGERLGPVFNFQLREQVAASRLVRGFQKPLPSLPKITAAIERQAAQIAKGRLTKTGLLAGESPEVAYQVDPNAREALLQSEQPASDGDSALDASTSALELALSTDAVIDAPLLDPERVFTGTEIDTSSNAAGSARGGTLFLARNTLFATRAVDLTEFDNGTAFQFLSTGDVRFDGSTNFTGLSSTPLLILASGTLTSAPRALVTVDAPFAAVIVGGGTNISAANSATFAGGAEQPLLLQDFALRNVGGDLALAAPSIRLNNAGLLAVGDVTVESRGAIRLQDNITSLPAFHRVPGTADTGFSPQGTGFAAGGLLSMHATDEFQARRTDFVGARTRITGEVVKIQLARFSNREFDASRSSVDLRAASVIDISGARFQVRDVSMQARTITLQAVNFAARSRVVLDSAIGRLAPGPNQGRPPRPGFVNFVRNVGYGGQPAQQFVSPRGPITIK